MTWTTCERGSVMTGSISSDGRMERAPCWFTCGSIRSMCAARSCCALHRVDLKMPLHHSEAAERAIDLLLGECEQDAACHGAFPQIRDDWKNVLAQLEKQPARVEYLPPKTAAPTTVEIQRDVFAEKIRTWMYARDTGARIPLIIHHAAEGDFAPFLQQAIGPSIPDLVADGMYLSVT